MLMAMLGYLAGVLPVVVMYVVDVMFSLVKREFLLEVEKIVFREIVGW